MSDKVKDAVEVLMADSMGIGVITLGETSFGLDIKALLLVAAAAFLFYFLWQQRKKFAEPYLSFPSVAALQSHSGRSRWGALPRLLQWLSLFAFVCAFIDPHLLINRQQEKTAATDRINPAHTPTEGIAIYLVLDQSGSMREEVDVSRRQRIAKIDLLREVTKEFIAGDAKLGLSGRPNDMIGLISFARGAPVLSPLTLDHASVLEELSRFAPVAQRDQDGTSIGYAIFKTANMIAATRHYAQELIEKGEPAYTIKESVMILITDGLQDPNPLDKGKRLRNIDVPEAAAYAKEQGVRMYIINVEPKLATAEFTAYRNIMTRAAELTGGKFFMVDSKANLAEIYSDIDKLEKSSLPADIQAGVNKDKRPDIYRRVSFYPFFVALGLLFLFAALVLEVTVLRRVP